MKRKPLFAAAMLIASGVVVGTAFAQSTTPAPLTPQQRLQALKARQDAAIAAQKARQNQIQRPTANPTPTAAPTTTPTTTPTTPTTATPTATPTTTARPTGAGGASGTGGAASTTATAAGGRGGAGGAGGTGAGGASATSAAPKPPVAISLDIEELKKTRPERRKAELDNLQARWGGTLLRDTRAAAELKLHAQRTAYLQRIRALATKANDSKTVQAVDILITKEDNRNADAMNALRSGALPVTAGAAK